MPRMDNYCNMIKTKKELNHYIEEDARANHVKMGYSYYIKLLYGNVHACVFRYLKSLRKYEYYHNKKSKLSIFYRFYNRRLGLKYNIALPINVIGYGIYIPHIEGGVIVNSKCIGNYFEINSGCVVGKGRTNDELPILGNNVRMTVGSKIIGKVVIGDNVIVAPNTVVINDIPDNCFVSGVPAKIIKKDGNKYISND